MYTTRNMTRQEFDAKQMLLNMHAPFTVEVIYRL